MKGGRVTQGLWAAFVSGALSVLGLYLQRRGRRSAVEEAWQAQVKELTDQLNREHEAALARADVREAVDDAEIARLNAALQQRGEDRQ